MPIPYTTITTSVNWGCLSKSLHLISERDISGLRTHSFRRECWVHGHIFESFLAQKHSPSRGFEPAFFHSKGECHDHQTRGDPPQFFLLLFSNLYPHVRIESFLDIQTIRALHPLGQSAPTGSLSFTVLGLFGNFPFLSRLFTLYV